MNNFDEGLKETRNYLYQQVDTLALLNKLSTSINCEILNLENYRINVIDENSYIIKFNLTSLINKLKEFLNEIHILIKGKKGFPIFGLGDIEAISIIKVAPSTDYKQYVISNNLNKEFKNLKNITSEILKNAQKENDYDTLTLIGNFSLFLNKNINS